MHTFFLFVCVAFQSVHTFAHSVVSHSFNQSVHASLTALLPSLLWPLWRMLEVTSLDVLMFCSRLLSFRQEVAAVSVGRMVPCLERLFKTVNMAFSSLYSRNVTCLTKHTQYCATVCPSSWKKCCCYAILDNYEMWINIDDTQLSFSVLTATVLWGTAFMSTFEFKQNTAYISGIHAIPYTRYNCSIEIQYYKIQYYKIKLFLSIARKASLFTTRVS